MLTTSKNNRISNNINIVCQVNELVWRAMLHWSLNLEAVIWSPPFPLWPWEIKKNSRGLIPSKWQQFSQNNTPFLPLQNYCPYVSHLYSRAEKLLENKIKTDITLKLLVSCSLVKCSSPSKTGWAELTAKLLRKGSAPCLWWGAKGPSLNYRRENCQEKSLKRWSLEILLFKDLYSVTTTSACLISIQTIKVGNFLMKKGSKLLYHTKKSS